MSQHELLPLSELTAISPIDGRYRSRVEELAPHTSEMALFRTRVEVEARYLVALSDAGLTPRSATTQEKKQLLDLGPNLTLEQAERIKEIENTTRHDVKAMEKAFREFVAGTSLEDFTEMIHFGLTSEDVNNLSYRLMLERAKSKVIVPALNELVDAFSDRAKENKSVPMLARTHGQPAVPTTLGKEFANIAFRLNRQVRKLEELKLTGKLNGAVGNFNALKLAAAQTEWIDFSKKFVESLGLESNPYTTQINPYEDVIEVFQTFQRINGVILDVDQDMWRYISDSWFIQEVKKGEVGSSTMPQKVNPIDFENSEGNLQIANSLFEGMGRKLAVSRLQRDLSDSTTIRNVGMGLAYSLLAYKSTLTGMGRVRPNYPVISEALNENWVILTEGVQTVLRRAGVEDPYTLIAGLSRGQKIGQSEWSEWVSSLSIDPKIKVELEHLSPEKYIGEAELLTTQALSDIAASRNESRKS